MSSFEHLFFRDSKSVIMRRLKKVFYRIMIFANVSFILMGLHLMVRDSWPSSIKDVQQVDLHHIGQRSISHSTNFNVTPNKASFALNHLPQFRTPFREIEPGKTIKHKESKPDMCPKYNSIYYLKIQKTASTTVFNMLHRYALQNNWRVATYKIRPQSGKQAFVRGLIPTFFPGVSDKYNLIADHSKYDKENIEKILEKPVLYWTLIRHPTRHLTSFLEYTPLMQRMGLIRGNSTPKYLELVQDYKTKPEQWPKKKLESVTWILNWQSKVLGFDTAQKQDLAGVEFKNQLKEVLENFYMGISDYFDESVLLFRRKYCLKFSDIIYVRLRKGGRERPLDPDLNKRVCANAHLDCYLYDMVNKTLWEKIEREGPDFQDELRHYRKVLGDIYDTCSHEYNQMRQGDIINVLLTKDMILFQPKTKWNEAFNVTAMDCAIMRVDERQFSNLIYFLQNANACDDPDSSLVKKCPIPWRGMSCEKYCEGDVDYESKLRALLSDRTSYLWS